MKEFSTLIRMWYQNHKRDLPWRSTSDAYVIWLSEVILQQTKVEQGLPYFVKFSERFPTVIDLANASEEEVLETWKGLGYYSRARNLHKAAKLVRDQFGGILPNSYSKLIQLPGVGEYTAAAVASFAFGEPRAVVDGNVFRLLSRVFNIHSPINSSAGKREFRLLADQLISEVHPGEHNQAMMEMGSLVCTPKSPNCEACVLRHNCLAFKKNNIAELPVKTAKPKSKFWNIHYAVIASNSGLVFSKDITGNVWKGLYQFPIISEELATEESYTPISNSGTLLATQKHVLSHRKITAFFYHIPYTALSKDTKSNIFEFTMGEAMEKAPITRLIQRFLEQNKEDLCQLIKSS